MRRFALLLLLLLALGHTKRIVLAQNATDRVLQLVNQVRAEHGLLPYQYNPTLAIAAQNQAAWMAQTGLYLHNHNGSTPTTRATAAGYRGHVSENIVGGWKLTPQQGVTWWRNSPVHFNTMISTRYTQAGIGFATGDNNQSYYVLVVGNPNGQAPRPPTAANTDTAVAPIVAPIPLVAANEDGSIIHTVRAGHTLWAISARYEVPLTDILLFNNLDEDALVQPGDTLIIQLAEGQAPPPTPTPPAVHSVRAGETAWTIAARYNLSLADLLWYNNLSEDDFLQPGDSLIVRLLPGQSPPPTATPPLAHIVQSGESLWSIAARHGLTLDEIKQYNNLTSDVVIAGQSLMIVAPTAAVVPPTVTATRVVSATMVTQTDVPTPTPVTTVQILSVNIQPTVAATSVPGSPATVTPEGVGRTLWLAATCLTLFAGFATIVIWREVN